MIEVLDGEIACKAPAGTAAPEKRAAILAQAPDAIGKKILADTSQSLRESQRPNLADPAIRALPVCALAIALALVEG